MADVGDQLLPSGCERAHLMKRLRFFASRDLLRKNLSNVLAHLANFI
jgi:hypothetical protein